MIKQKNILLFLAKEDFNNHEYTTIKNSLAKKNFNIFVTSDSYSFCKSDNGKIVQPDIRLENVNRNNFEAFIIIGGYGISKYFNHNLLKEKIVNFYKANKIVAAICAAPVLLYNALGDVAKFTVHPDFEKYINKNSLKESCTVQDKGVITASLPECAEQFSGQIIKALLNK